MAKPRLSTQADAVGTLSALSTTAKTDLVAAINELFLSASNGKTSIATAVTGMGVAATGSDTFAQLATKIGNISKDANATAAQLLVGQTAYVGGAKVTGTMPNNGAVTITPSTANQAVVAGYHSGAGIVQGSPNLAAGNILNGINIFGVIGNVVPGTPYASGSASTGNFSLNMTRYDGTVGGTQPGLTVGGLSFTPATVVMWKPSNSAPLASVAHSLLNNGPSRSDIFTASGYFRFNTDCYFTSGGFQLICGSSILNDPGWSWLAFAN